MFFREGMMDDFGQESESPLLCEQASNSQASSKQQAMQLPSDIKR